MFENKIVLITGSSKGIGKKVSFKFSSLGAQVVLNDVLSQKDDLEKAKKEIEEKGGKAEYLIADVSNYEEVEKMISEIKEKFGKLDVVINNAGICRDKTLAKMTKDEWQSVIDINLTGVFNCSKASLPFLIPEHGSIINMSSVVGQSGNFGQANYAASKAGIIGFTKSLSKEVGRFGVRVNAVAPGFIETRLTEAIPDEFKSAVKKLTSLGRFGNPEEVANVIVFLASENASFITGEVINIDGGLAI